MMGRGGKVGGVMLFRKSILDSNALLPPLPPPLASSPLKNQDVSIVKN